MTFVISTLKAIFIFLNILALFSAAVYLGFGAFMLISKWDVMGLGLHEISVALLATGAGAIVLTMIGFCSGTGRRSLAMQFFSGCLLLGAIYQVGFGVLVMIRRGKTEEYMDNSWNEMSEKLRDAFETAHGCCGFKSTSDRTSCDEMRISNSVACSTKLSGRQSDLLTWLAISLFSFALLTFLNYLTAYALIQQYAKARRQFKQRESERRKSSKKDEKTLEIQKKYNTDEKMKEEPIKTVSTVKSDTIKFAPKVLDFFKPTPKPDIKKQLERSAGSLMTYEEIAAKYKNNSQK